MSGGIKGFARETVGQMLDQTAYHLTQASRSHDEESIHKMRVSIRRLQQGLRLFRQFLDRAEVKRIRRDLREYLRAAAEVRNRDIAMMLAAEVAPNAELVHRLDAERKAEMRKLRALLKARARSAGKWRAKLGLN